jgi:hypothetical protein
MSPHIDALASGLGAAQGGILGSIVVMPLDMVASKQACGDERKAGQILRDVARRDGILGLWSGRIIIWKCLYATLNRGLMYGTLTWLTSLVVRTRPASGALSSAGSTMVLAYIADLLTKPLVAPLETVIIRLNRSETGETVRTLIPLMLKEGGVGFFFRGLPTHLGSSWRQAITEALFEQLRRLVGAVWGGQRLDGELGAGTAFAIGWLARGLATIVVQPLFRVRVSGTRPSFHRTPHYLAQERVPRGGVLGNYYLQSESFLHHRADTQHGVNIDEARATVGCRNLQQSGNLWLLGWLCAGARAGCNLTSMPQSCEGTFHPGQS